MNKRWTDKTINDVDNLPEFQELEEELLNKTGGWGRTWAKQGSPFMGSHSTFITKSEVVVMIGSRRKDLYKHPLQIVRWCRPGARATVLFGRIIDILYRHEVPFETPYEKVRPLPRPPLRK